MTPQRFSAAPLDRPTRWTSIGLVVALVGLSLSIWGSAGPGPAWVTLALSAALLGLAFGYAPSAYELDGSSVRIVRHWFGGRTFALTGPAQRLGWTFGLGGLRLAGSGGLFGWFGLFYRRDVGRYRAYLTDRSQVVALDTASGLVVCSPADPDAFIAAVGAQT